MVILTDNVYFQCAEVRSLTCFNNIVQKGWSLTKDGTQTPVYGQQYQINIQYDPSDDDPNKVNLRGGIGVISVALSSKKECKLEMRNILKQIHRQRRDDIALTDAFEEHFGGVDGKKNDSDD